MWLFLVQDSKWKIDTEFYIYMCIYIQNVGFKELIFWLTFQLAIAST